MIQFNHYSGLEPANLSLHKMKWGPVEISSLWDHQIWLYSKTVEGWQVGVTPKNPFLGIFKICRCLVFSHCKTLQTVLRVKKMYNSIYLENHFLRCVMERTQHLQLRIFGCFYLLCLITFIILLSLKTKAKKTCTANNTGKTRLGSGMHVCIAVPRSS